MKFLICISAASKYRFVLAFLQVTIHIVLKINFKSWLHKITVPVPNHRYWLPLLNGSIKKVGDEKIIVFQAKGADLL